ncbi:MAG: hypothetical protein IPJ19_05870 [Planctomycetes bacterium]|nr:hypothetical protein [Planctomycetota bacterium]
MSSLFSTYSVAVLLSALPPAPTANTDLALDLQGNLGVHTLQVGPGRVAHYQVVGTLSNASSDGLAYFSTNLSFSGGALPQATNPTSGTMASFAPPLGFSNPAGFGGTIVGGELVQVGGAQNTIRNTIAAAPLGNVVLGVAQPSAPQVLVSGDLAAPYVVGTYSLAAHGSRANVILPGQTGTPFYKVDKVGNTSSNALVVEVHAILARPGVVSVGVGQEQTLAIDAGPANAGRTYVCLGSLSGTTPGLMLPGGAILPVHPDGYTSFTVNHPNTAILQNSMGVLDANGRGRVVFHPDSRFVGKTVNHAFYLPSTGLEFVSESEAVQVVQ